MMQTRMTPADAIREQMEVRNATATALAEQINVNPFTFGKIADGSDRVGLRKLIYVMQKLGYKVEITVTPHDAFEN